MDVDLFIDELHRENEAWFADKTTGQTCYWPRELRDERAAHALMPRWFNEIRGVDVIGRFAARVPDIELKTLVGQQVGDEAKHARLCARRIRALGLEVKSYEPTLAQLAFGDFLDQLQYPEEFFSAQQFTVETQSIKRNDAALDKFDPTTAEMFRRHINPDERFHAKLGRLGLRRYAIDSPSQERALAAARRVRELHVQMVEQHIDRLAALGIVER